MSGQTKLGSKLVVFFLVEARNGLVASTTLVLLLRIKQVLVNHIKCMHSAPHLLFALLLHLRVGLSLDLLEPGRRSELDGLIK